MNEVASKSPGTDTAVDVSPDRGSDSGTSQFDPFSSDIRTYLAHRPQLDEPAPHPPGSKSSDPPTAFVRRLESHIELPPGSMVGEEYEVDHRLGAGAMGEVYAARHVKLDKCVAIKAISPRLSEDSAAVERFAQEARTLARMRHPGLVDVLGFGELADGRAYFVMEYLSGESLFDRLQRGRLGRDEALDIFGQIARALEAAHAHGVVHRDLKPENTFLTRVTNEQRPMLKLLDFGLARLVVEVDRRAERTQSGVVIGTAMYLSPEQARGPDVDGRTDIYALGCIGYELLLGRHPFQDESTASALIAAHLHGAPPIPRSIDPNIAPELDLMLFAMLAKDPAHRPTLPQIRAVIEGVRSPIAVRAETPLPAPRSADRRTVAIAAVAMLGGIAIGAAVLGSRSSDERPTAFAIPNTPDAAASMPTAAAPMSTAALDAPVVIGVPPPAAIDAGVAQTRVAVGPRRPRPLATKAPVDAGSVANSTDESLDVTPAPAESTPPPRGFLKVLSPPDAKIFVDGTTPVGTLSKLSLAPGQHKIQFIVGADENSFLVMIEPGQTVTLDKRDLHRARPVSIDRNQTINPFAKKPELR